MRDTTRTSYGKRASRSTGRLEIARAYVKARYGESGPVLPPGFRTFNHG